MRKFISVIKTSKEFSNITTHDGLLRNIQSIIKKAKNTARDIYRDEVEKGNLIRFWTKKTLTSGGLPEFTTVCVWRSMEDYKNFNSRLDIKEYRKLLEANLIRQDFSTHSFKSHLL